VIPVTGATCAITDLTINPQKLGYLTAEARSAQRKTLGFLTTETQSTQRPEYSYQKVFLAVLSVSAVTLFFSELCELCVLCGENLFVCVIAIRSGFNVAPRNLGVNLLYWRIFDSVIRREM